MNRTNSYAIPPQSRGVADVLNEAADSEDRNLEGNRRQALTLQQIKSEQQKNQLAAEQGARDQTRFGYEVEELDQKKKIRDNLASYHKQDSADAQTHFFERVENPAWMAATKQASAMPVAEGQAAPTIDPSISQYINQPIDLASRKGLSATAAYTSAKFINAAKHNLLSSDDIEKTLATRERLEKQGHLADARAALNGDPDALKNLTAAMGLPAGSTSLTTEMDKNGVPTLFVTSRDDKGNMVKKDVSHLIAAVSPEFYDAVMVKPTATAAARSNVVYQGKAGDAAISNAASSAQQAASSAVSAAATTKNAETNATNSKNLGELYKARAAAILNPATKTNTAEVRPRFYSLELDADKKNIVIPSGFSNYGRISGVAQGLGLHEGQANKFAQTEWANLMGEREGAIARLKAKLDPKGTKYWSTQEKVALEDRALTMMTDDLIKDKSEKGEMFQKITAYATQVENRRSAALQTNKDEE